jgi:hypothetical protein
MPPAEDAAARSESTASRLISQRIEELGDWRGATLATMRRLILEAEPDIVEEWKWEVPAWYCNGLICTGETYKTAVKLTFAKGASLDDPEHLFTSSLTGNVRRAIDIRQDDIVNEKAFKDLIRSAVAFNLKSGKKK